MEIILFLNLHAVQNYDKNIKSNLWPQKHDIISYKLSFLIKLVIFCFSDQNQLQISNSNQSHISRVISSQMRFSECWKCETVLEL